MQQRCELLEAALNYTYEKFLTRNMRIRLDCIGPQGLTTEGLETILRSLSPPLAPVSLNSPKNVWISTLGNTQINNANCGVTKLPRCIYQSTIQLR